MRLLNQSVILIFTLVVLTATSGVTVHKHICMGHVRNVALMHDAEVCGMEGEMEMPEGCCSDAVELFKVEELDKVVLDLDLNHEYFVLAVLGDFQYEFTIEETETNQTAFLTYKPPLIERDLTIDVQSFLL